MAMSSSTTALYIRHEIGVSLTWSPRRQLGNNKQKLNSKQLLC